MKNEESNLFDHLEDADALAHMPEDLPPMEDILMAKRITDRVEKEIQKEMKKGGKGRAKRIAVAACVLLAVGIVGYNPILAAFQRMFHYLPGVGMYANEEGGKVYRGEIICGTLERDGIVATLEQLYGSIEGDYGLLHGKIRFTGEGLPNQAEIPQDQRMDMLKDMFKMTWYENGKETASSLSGSTFQGEDSGEVVFFERSIRKYYDKNNATLEENIYEVEIKGFEGRLQYRWVPVDGEENVNYFGISQEQNGTTVTAKAEMVDGKTQMEYYWDGSEEVSRANESRKREFRSLWPYHMNLDDPFFYVVDKNGEQKEPKKAKGMTNGYTFEVDAEKEDFPLTLHVTPFTGMGLEKKTITLPLPKNGETWDEGMTVPFPYGDVEILSVKRQDGMLDNGDPNGEAEPGTFAEIRYRVHSKEGNREMYSIEIEGDTIRSSSWEANWQGESICTLGMVETDEGELEITLSKPFYWIGEEYQLVLEKYEE